MSSRRAFSISAVRYSRNRPIVAGRALAFLASATCSATMIIVSAETMTAAIAITRLTARSYASADGSPGPHPSQAISEPPKTPTIELLCTASRNESAIERQAHSRQASLRVHDHGGAAIAIPTRLHCLSDVTMPAAA